MASDHDEAPMTPAHERMLARLLIIEGTVLLCALPAVAMPTTWMAAIHETLGLGPMPHGPLMEYLTRSLSLVYGLIAPILMTLAWDVDRYRPLIRVVGWLHLVGASILVILDFASGLPLWWLVVEGPIVAGFGLGLLNLTHWSRQSTT